MLTGILFTLSNETNYGSICITIAIISAVLNQIINITYDYHNLKHSIDHNNTTGEKEYAFPVEVIQFIKNVIHKSQIATLLQSKWNFQSYLRSALIEKKQVSIYLIQAKIFSGTVSAVYQDHFDLKLDNSRLSIFNGSVIYISKERDFDD
jgi:hypothetical protein